MKSLPQEELIRLNAGSNMKAVPKKQIIYFPDESSNSVYLIKNGKVKISRLSDDGREIIIAILGPGEIFGESSIADSTSKREEFAEATEDTILCLMFSEIIQELMRKDPNFGFKITKIISFRFKKIQSRFESLIFKSSEERVKCFIKELAHEEGQKTADGAIEIKLKLTQEDIGKLTATSRQMVTTVFNDLEKKNIVSYNRKRILIKNMNGF
jgi:CRP-like cAMP-binding protein